MVFIFFDNFILNLIVMSLNLTSLLNQLTGEYLFYLGFTVSWKRTLIVNQDEVVPRVVVLINFLLSCRANEG